MVNLRGDAAAEGRADVTLATSGTPSAPPPRPSDRLRALAREVERIGRGRADPESIIIGKMTVAYKLRRLAWELKR